VKFKKTIITASATLALAGIGMGAAFAVWSANGSGTAAAAAKVAQSLTVTAVTPSGPSGASLYPGGPAGQVYVSITNPNPYAVTITGFTWGTPVSTNTTACPNSNISLDPGAPTTASLPVPAGGTLSAVQINGVLDLNHAAPDGCQGVAFDVPLTVTGVQQ
jgi:hypothetical protein